MFEYSNLTNEEKNKIIKDVSRRLFNTIEDIKNFDKEAAIIEPNYIESFLEDIEYTIKQMKEEARGDYGMGVFSDQ